MTLTKIVCDSCGNKTSKKHKYCPNCGEESPWEEEAVYEFDEDDLPFIFECKFHDDYFYLWDEFSSKYFQGCPEKEDIKNLPENFPSLKYADAWSYYIITKGLELEGPFGTEEKAEDFLESDST